MHRPPKTNASCGCRTREPPCAVASGFHSVEVYAPEAVLASLAVPLRRIRFNTATAEHEFACLGVAKHLWAGKTIGDQHDVITATEWASAIALVGWCFHGGSE